MKRKTVVIHQPDFMPYLGFFHRFLHADLYIALDHVQFVNNTSRSWTHRDKIKTAQGEKWLTVSVKKAPRETPINQVELSTTVDWRSSNLELLKANYKQSAYFNEIMPNIEMVYAYAGLYLSEFNLSSIKMLMRVLDIHIPIILASSLDPHGTKNELLVDLLRKVGASHYLSGTGASDYFSPDSFNAAGIKVLWQEFKHPIYPQKHGDFIPYLSSIDMLFNCGIEKSSKLIRGM